MTRLPIAQAPKGGSVWHHLQALRSDLIGYVEHLASQGDFLRIPLGLTSAYFVNREDLVREVLVRQAPIFHKPAAVKRIAGGLFGQNVFTSDGEVWRALRAAMQPAFHTQRIQAYTATMARLTEEVLATWPDDAVVDVPHEMMQLTMGITTRSLFSVDLRDDAAGDAIVRFIQRFNERLASPVPIPSWLPTPGNRELKRLVQIGNDLLQPIIDERRRTGEDKGDVLSMLLIAQAQDEHGILSDHQVRNEVTNLFAAGYEVTAHTLAFTLYLIAAHPAVEARLRAEIDGAVGSGQVTADDLQHLPYLAMVVKESMRLLPVTTVLARQASAQTTVDGHSIRKGETVLIAPWTLHRHPHYYEDPLRFDPERFAPEREASIPKHAYIPFSTGPRICLGNAFATLQMKINLVTLLQHVRLALLPGYRFEPFYQFNTRPKGGLPMRCQRRRM